MSPVSQELHHEHAFAENQTLLTYYSRLADAFDEERLNMIRRLDDVDIHHVELQKSRLETAKKAEQVSELQKALSDSHFYLFDEREHLLKITSENQELRDRDVENRRRIQDLLALTRPVTQEVTYFRGAKPRTVCLQNGDPSSHTSTNVIRTIYLPNNKTVEQLQATVESLRTRLIGTEKLSEEREKAHREDRRIQIEETKAAKAEDKAVISSLEKQVDDLIKSNRQSLKEYLVLKHEFQKERRDLMEQLNESRESTAAATNELNQKTLIMEKTIEEAKTREEARCEEITSEFRKQTMDREEELAMVREQYAVTQQLYDDKIEALHSKYAKLLAKFKALERRHGLEMAGLRKDAATLKQRYRDTTRQILAMNLTERKSKLSGLELLLDTE